MLTAQSKSARSFVFLIVVSVMAVFSGIFAYSQPNAVMNSQPNTYRTIENWAKLPAGRTWGQTSGVDVDSHDHVWVAERCGGTTCIGKTSDPVLEFDSSGKLLKAFGSGMFIHPHGICVDPEDNVWVTDEQDHEGKGQQILKFSPDGNLLMTLGKAGVAGDGPDTFNQPSDAIVAPNGDIFVADGHTPGYFNSRIIKFSKDGKFIKSWGKRGSAPGELEGAHGLTMDSRGRLFVADRSNNRIQIFDQNGRFLDQWMQFGRPSGIFIDKKDNLYVADSESIGEVVAWTGTFAFLPKGYGYNPGVKRGIRVGSAKDGSVIAFIPDPHPPSDPPLASTAAEGVAADSKGNIYGAEVTDMDVKKYVKRK